ncbi:AraC family transcriptional regulator [Paenibacillus paeoniae]|uniref:AraC family transcriptional regulator n=1 Tax=Paenibacillus paeoniae TaxID=2292705 RepID=A0A371PMZ6_9BACL|nr:AraC family transcriptional regulator [Paenibacillus paeoniae]REK77576.1 AraC family transcriptional regulator [Paenibacillus paeoniae]
MNEPSVAISMVFPVMKTIVHKGYNAEDFCRYASFDSALLQDVEARIPGSELKRLMIEAAIYTNDDHFGLHQGLIMEFADMGLLGYVMMHSPTIGDALDAYQRYNLILCSGFNLAWDVVDDDFLLTMRLQEGSEDSRHCMEEMASSLFRMIGKLSNRIIPLYEVQFSHEAPSDIEPYLPVFGRVPSFGCESNSLRMSRETLDYPAIYSDPRLLSVFETIAQETRDGMSESAGLQEQMMRWMRKTLPTRFPTLQQAAEQFGMSVRTLQHKLKSESTTFNDLSVQVRKETAMRYLRNRNASVGDIAYALHFSEPSAFQSAFKKWTGMTPGQYRANPEQANEESGAYTSASRAAGSNPAS